MRLLTSRWSPSWPELLGGRLLGGHLLDRRHRLVLGSLDLLGRRCLGGAGLGLDSACGAVDLLGRVVGLLLDVAAGLFDGDGDVLDLFAHAAGQLGGALTHEAGLRGHDAEGVFGEVDRVVVDLLDARQVLLDDRLLAQALEGGLATLGERVVEVGGLLDVRVGELLQLVGGQLAADLLDLGRDFLRERLDAGLGLVEAGLCGFGQIGDQGLGLAVAGFETRLRGLGSGLGALTELGELLGDLRERIVAGADCGIEGGRNCGWWSRGHSFCRSPIALQHMRSRWSRRRCRAHVGLSSIRRDGRCRKPPRSSGSSPREMRNRGTIGIGVSELQYPRCASNCKHSANTCGPRHLFPTRGGRSYS